MSNMDYRISSFVTLVSLVILISMSGIVPAFAITNPYLACPDCNDTSNIQQIPQVAITVTTDKPAYDHNSQIMITGHIVNPYPGQDVALEITSPSGNVVTAAQVTLDNNGDFTTTISTANNKWSENGQYTVRAHQGDDQVVGLAVFQIVGQIPTSYPQNSTQSLNDILHQRYEMARKLQELTTPSSNPSPPNQPIPSPQSPTPTPAKIPNWVKGILGYYAQGKLSDADLIQALQFLIQQGIIKV
jgi:hypothetical protein